MKDFVIYLFAVFAMVVVVACNIRVRNMEYEEQSSEVL